jgi:hypothetical protein
MTGEERLKILKMVQEGKINAEDAVELLSALDVATAHKGSQAAPAGSGAMPGRRDNRWFRVRITDSDTGKTRVNVRLPINMVSAGLKMGMRFAPVQVEGLDSSELMDFIRSGEVGQIVDIFDDEDGEHVEVFIE